MQPRWSKKTDELVRQIAEGCQPSLQSELGAWIQSGPRFADFVAAHRDKIRKKFATAGDREVRLDVRAELLVAHLVLGDRRFDVAFEAAGAPRGGPDLSLRYRTNQSINLEVTRLRSSADPSTLASVVATKVRQLTSGVPNGLTVVGQQLGITEDVLADAVKHVKTRAEARDDPFFARRGLRDARDFYTHFLRLSSVFVLDESSASVHLANRQTRHPIPDEALGRLCACLGIMAAVPNTPRTPA